MNAPRSIFGMRALVVAMLLVMVQITVAQSGVDPHAGVAGAPPLSQEQMRPQPQPMRAPSTPEQHQAFLDALDLSPLGGTAAFYDGRLRSFESFANQIMGFVSGPRDVNGQSPHITYFDLIFHGDRYHDEPLIYIKKKPMRAELADALRNSPFADEPNAEQRLSEMVESGLVEPHMLQQPAAQSLLDRWSRDLIRTAKFVEQIENAMRVREARVLIETWRPIPPSAGDELTPWLDMLSLGQPTPVLDQRMQAELVDPWMAFVNGWITEDAPRVNLAAQQLALVLPSVNPELYPSKSRLAWESWYFRAKNLTWIWLFYGLAIVPLLLSVVFRWPGARFTGWVMFLLAFALHTFAIGLRWYVAQRWPNSNMFEAVTTAAWFGGCCAIVLEFLARRTPMRGVFMLGSAVASMVALMCAWFMPLALNPDINNMMPVLHDVWLYIHTNVIIFSYCLIFMAAVSALLYLLYRGCKLTRSDNEEDRATIEYARVGGAGSLVMAGTTSALSSRAGSANRAATFGQVLDGTTMILMELSFVLLWTGLVMGAIWADHSWGRPWGWDPKEVFALNTFIVFAVLVHVRLVVKDKGLWTALLALIGAGVMLFNWIVINFVISGLHSYA